MKRDYKALALNIIQNGRYFERRVTHDGDGESGPYTTSYHTFRLGGLEVYKAPTGGIYLESRKINKHDEYGMPFVFIPIHHKFMKNPDVQKAFEDRMDIDEFLALGWT